MSIGKELVPCLACGQDLKGYGILICADCLDEKCVEFERFAEYFLEPDIEVTEKLEEIPELNDIIVKEKDPK